MLKSDTRENKLQIQQGQNKCSFLKRKLQNQQSILEKTKSILTSELALNY